METVTFKKGEALPLEMTIKLNGVIQDVSTATLTLGVKKRKTDTVKVISKTDVQFNKTQAADGIVSVLLTSENLNLSPGMYIGELTVLFSDLTYDKSDDFIMEIQQSVN